MNKFPVCPIFIPANRLEWVEKTFDKGADAVIILCTNLAGAGIGASIEQETGVPVLDSVVLTVWGALHSIGRNTSSLFQWAPAISKIA